MRYDPSYWVAHKAHLRAAGAMPEHRVEEDESGDVRPKMLRAEQQRKVAVTAILTAQVTTMVVTLRFSKTSTHYLNGTAVFLAEGLKMAICMSVLAYQHGNRLGEYLWQELARRPKDLILVSVPALLYLLQNNLLFFAMERLEAVVYQVTYQLKILTTAICMVLIMGKRLSLQQWLALLLLASGVALAQSGTARDTSGLVLGAARARSSASQFAGLVALIVACLTSGFAGVYTEKLLKQTTASLWLRNVQLGIWSLVAGAGGLYFGEYNRIKAGGFFQGYTLVVWFVVLLQAASGILVALVIKLADNIVKNFSAAMSLLLSTLVSVPLFGFRPTGHFMVGACMVLLSAHLYSGGSMPGCALGCLEHASKRGSAKADKVMGTLRSLRFSTSAEEV